MAQTLTEQQIEPAVRAWTRLLSGRCSASTSRTRRSPASRRSSASCRASPAPTTPAHRAKETRSQDGGAPRSRGALRAAKLDAPSREETYMNDTVITMEGLTRLTEELE